MLFLEEIEKICGGANSQEPLDRIQDEIDSALGWHCWHCTTGPLTILRLEIGRLVGDWAIGDWRSSGD